MKIIIDAPVFVLQWKYNWLESKTCLDSFKLGIRPGERLISRVTWSMSMCVTTRWHGPGQCALTWTLACCKWNNLPISCSIHRERSDGDVRNSLQNIVRLTYDIVCHVGSCILSLDYFISIMPPYGCMKGRIAALSAAKFLHLLHWSGLSDIKC